MIFKYFKKIYLVLAFTLVAFPGCAPLVKTNMDSYMENQELYKGKKIVFTADIEDLLERYELYKDKEVELTAPVIYFGKEDSQTWYLTLEKDGGGIRAYEDNYRNYISQDALNLLIWAKSEDGEVAVRGKLKENGIELNQLAYRGYVVDTNLRPYRYRYYYRPYYGHYYGYHYSYCY